MENLIEGKEGEKKGESGKMNWWCFIGGRVEEMEVERKERRDRMGLEEELEECVGEKKRESGKMNWSFFY